MRDLITIIAAGSMMTAYALVSPTLVEALQAPAAPPQKAFVQRLSQAGGEAPVSAVSGPTARETAPVPDRALPLFARSAETP